MTISMDDIQIAKDAMVEGWNGCKQTNYFGINARARCDCDLGTIDGCKARVEAIAAAIAKARAALTAPEREDTK